MAVTALVLAGPVRAEPPGLYLPDGSFDMMVACPVWENLSTGETRGEVTKDPQRLYLCIQVLMLKTVKADAMIEHLGQRISKLEEMIEAIGKDGATRE